MVFFLTSVPLCTAIYLLVNISYFTVMDKEQLLASKAVAVVCNSSFILRLGIIYWTNLKKIEVFKDEETEKLIRRLVKNIFLNMA